MGLEYDLVAQDSKWESLVAKLDTEQQKFMQSFNDALDSNNNGNLTTLTSKLGVDGFQDAGAIPDRTALEKAWIIKDNKIDLTNMPKELPLFEGCIRTMFRNIADKVASLWGKLGFTVEWVSWKIEDSSDKMTQNELTQYLSNFTTAFGKKIAIENGQIFAGWIGIDISQIRWGMSVKSLTDELGWLGVLYNGKSALQASWFIQVGNKLYPMLGKWWYSESSVNVFANLNTAEKLLTQPLSLTWANLFDNSSSELNDTSIALIDEAINGAWGVGAVKDYLTKNPDARLSIKWQVSNTSNATLDTSITAWPVAFWGKSYELTSQTLPLNRALAVGKYLESKGIPSGKIDIGLSWSNWIGVSSAPTERRVDLQLINWSTDK